MAAESGRLHPAEQLLNEDFQKLLANAGKTTGKMHGGKGGGSGGGGEESLLHRLLPAVLRGDSQNQNQSGGLPYSAPQVVGGGTTSGGSPILLIGVFAAIAGVIWYVLDKKKHPGEAKK